MSDYNCGDGWGQWVESFFLLLSSDTKLIKTGNDAHNKVDCVYEGNSKKCLEYQYLRGHYLNQTNPLDY